MRIVAFAYACGPDRGSEPGAGWGMARMLATMAEVWVITSTEDAAAIEARVPSLPEGRRIHFLPVDLPRWSRWWKKGHRGIRLHYMLWQVAALREARRLHRQQRFDLSWHITFSTVWLGSLLPLLRIPFVYGPVGGGVSPPWRLVPTLGLRGVAYELTRAAVNKVARYANPIARLAWLRASLILVQNNETAAWLPRSCHSKTKVFHHVVLDGLPRSPAAEGQARTALFAGRLLPLKGLALALRALAQTESWKLVICGRGPEEGRLAELARQLGVEDRVEFRGWLERDHLLSVMADEAQVFLFPCLHEEGGWAVAEAVAAGLPIVCLDVGGPPVIAQGRCIAVPTRGGSSQVIQDLARGLDDALSLSSSSTDRPAIGIVERSRLLRLLISTALLPALDPPAGQRPPGNG